MYFYYFLGLLSVFLFLHGFFPIARSPKNMEYGLPTNINNISLQPQVYSSKIQKTIIIVIDALRLDFATTEYMPLTSRITKDNGCINTVTVEIPTVTLPRIKALTVGNVPQFIDLVLNLASTEILQDSLIHSLYKEGKAVVFYGDDTWLKLFPNYFTRYEGTNSFYVRDFKEVDDNVTRNVHLELKNNDWDVMILHYLGLDHIGHVYGPFSSHIPQKLKEMDEIIYNIYSTMLRRNETFLLIITGDHGMRDSGGHGGASYFETHVPLLAIGLQCENGSLSQIDVPVNLAVLLGLNIPSTCIGQIRPNLLPISLEKYLFALRYNNLLLLDKENLCEDHFASATKFHEMYIKSFDEINALKAIDLYKNCSSAISDYLIKSSVKQDFNSLVVSILMMLNALLVLIKNLIGQKTDVVPANSIKYLIYLVIIFVQFILPTPMFSFMSIIMLTVFLVTNLIILVNVRAVIKTTENILKLLILVTIIHPVTFSSSSFVEEENQYWYFFTNILIIYIILVHIRQLKIVCFWVGLTSVLRFIRTINSTGDKWANHPDFSDWLLINHNYFYHELFFIFGLVLTYFTCMLMNRNFKVNILNIIIFVSIFVLKSTDYENLLLGRLIWFFILCHTIFFYDCPKMVIWALISTLLLKPYNIILIPFCILTSINLSKIFRDTTKITICHIWLGNTLYFAQGHSNSLASVDVSVGYIGLSEYQPLLVILQVVCHTYAFPVMCHFLVLSNKHINRDRVWTILFCNQMYITMITCIITVVFRHHLFVWSVFAPKLFIESVHLIFLFIELSIYYCFNKFKIIFNYALSK